MNHTFRVLYCVSAWLYLCFWGLSAGDSGLASSFPHTNSSAPVGLRDYRRYFANDSLIGRPVPCTREDKICFRHNLIFHPTSNKCTSAEDTSVNRTEFEQGSGRFVGASLDRDLCTGYRMAYDGNCYEKEIVRDVICGREANIVKHPFGGKECLVTQANPIVIEQPEEDGYCVIPDFRFPDWERRVFYNNPLSEIQGFETQFPERNFTQKNLRCESAQAVCFSEGKVFVAGFEGCYPLLEQGLCPEDHVVALNIQAATEGRAEGTCVHVRGGCPKGHKRMIFDGECHEDREIALEAPGDIILNPFGNYIVSSFGVLEISPILNESLCVLRFNPTKPLGSGQSALVFPCGVNDKQKCENYEVLNEHQLPML